MSLTKVHEAEELLTAVEARDFLGVSRQKFSQLAKNELKQYAIPNVRDRRVTLYPKSVLVAINARSRPASNHGKPSRRPPQPAVAQVSAALAG